MWTQKPNQRERAKHLVKNKRKPKRVGGKQRGRVYQDSHRHRNYRSPSTYSESDSDNAEAGRWTFRNVRFLEDRYELLHIVGEGTFGTVVVAFDHKRNIRVAIKIIRSVQRYLEDAEDEILILDEIGESQRGHPGRDICVKILKEFEIKQDGKRHTCMVFKKYGPSLYEILKGNKTVFSLEATRSIAYQLFQALDFLHGIGIVHTDLKPENVLLYDEDRDSDSNSAISGDNTLSTLRLIDFGGATLEHERHATVINTRQFRCPEVILNCGWSYASDIWSLGCIVVEVFTGKLLFDVHEPAEHLRLIEHVMCERFPPGLTNHALFYRKLSKKAWQRISRAPKLCHVIQDEDLLDLIARCLEADSQERITAREALNHPFFDCLDPSEYE